jgi:hypothetical protein
LFVIDIGSRTVEIAGIGRDPGGGWMEQMARNLVDTEDGFLRGKRYVIIDRDPLYPGAFRGILKWVGVVAVRLPAKRAKFVLAMIRPQLARRSCVRPLLRSSANCIPNRRILLMASRMTI